MLRRIVSLAVVAFLVFGVVVVAGETALAIAQVAEVDMVSVASDGTRATSSSYSPVVSGDGSVVAYFSDASNLVPADTNARSDVFLHDRATGVTSRGSIASGGVQANGDSYSPTVSGNGTAIAFASDADNLVSGDTNDAGDVFIHDRATGSTSRVSVASDGSEGNGTSSSASVSRDGSVVAFVSVANNLVSGDTNDAADVFVRDRVMGATTRVSVASDGTQATNISENSAVSGDGSIVVFLSYADNLVPGDTNDAADVFVHDRAAGTTTRVSIASDGTQANGPSEDPTVSDDGRIVVYSSYADNLGPGDSNNRSDVLAYDRVGGTTTRVSVASDGTQANYDSYAPAVACDGTVVVYMSYADNLVPDDTNHFKDVFVHDRATGTTTRVSVATDGTQANEDSILPQVSSDGTVVVYRSDASNLVPGDVNNDADVFAVSLSKVLPPAFDVEPEVSCDDIVISWTAEDVAGWDIEIGYPPDYWYSTPLTEPSGFVRFSEPWL